MLRKLLTIRFVLVHMLRRGLIIRFVWFICNGSRLHSGLFGLYVTEVAYNPVCLVHMLRRSLTIRFVWFICYGSRLQSGLFGSYVTEVAYNPGCLVYMQCTAYFIEMSIGSSYFICNIFNFAAKYSNKKRLPPERNHALI